MATLAEDQRHQDFTISNEASMLQREQTRKANEANKRSLWLQTSKQAYHIHESMSSSAQPRIITTERRPMEKTLLSSWHSVRIHTTHHSRVGRLSSNVSLITWERPAQEAVVVVVVRCRLCFCCGATATRRTNSTDNLCAETVATDA